MNRSLLWLPRTLGLLFVTFLAVFSLDVFGEYSGLGETLTALAMHLIPAAVALVALVVAWRWEWTGIILFGGLGLAYLLSSLDHPRWIPVISGPLFLIGALFLVSWMYRRKQQAS